MISVQKCGFTLRKILTDVMFALGVLMETHRESQELLHCNERKELWHCRRKTCEGVRHI